MADEIPISCIAGLNTYQDEAFKTAVFPPEIGPLYCAMGALGEAGELNDVLLTYYMKQLPDAGATPDFVTIVSALEKAINACKEVERLKKLARKRRLILPPLPPLDDEAKARVKSEQGDCMWYQAGVAEVTGHRLSDVCQLNIKKLRERRDAGVIASAGETIEERKAASDQS